LFFFQVAQVKEYIPQSTDADTIVMDGEILLVDLKTKKPLPFGTLGITSTIYWIDYHHILVFNFLFI
jgi:hypothetical protein